MVEIGPSLSAMPFVKVLGIDVHYAERGASVDEAKRTSVLLHGFPLDLRSSVASFEPAFAGRPRWRRLYLDFPGMGQTRAPAWVASTDDVFRVTKAAVEALAPARYALGGSSFGGYIAAGLAAATLDSVLGMALVVPMVLPHGNRELAPRRVLVREDGLIGSEIAEETAVIVTAETLRRTARRLRTRSPSPMTTRLPGLRHATAAPSRSCHRLERSTAQRLSSPGARTRSSDSMTSGGSSDSGRV